MRNTKKHTMGTKYKNLKEQICSIENIQDAYLKARKGKRKTRSYLEFKEYAELNLFHIHQELNNETYEMDPSYAFTIYVPKERNIKALSFRDRVVQHAINNIIEPIFEKTFLPNTYACRKDKGTHKAVKYAQSIMRKCDKPLYYLKIDYKKFFKNIEYDILYKLIEKKISCKFTLNLIRGIFPEGESNIPVGWLMSQLSANIVGSRTDHYIHHTLKQRRWVRYMDDIIIFNNDISELKYMQKQLEQFSLEKLNLTFSKWSIRPISKGLDFLGYRIFTNYKLIRKDSVIRAKRKIYKYKKLGLIYKQKQFTGSWNGHILWADCYNLKRKIYDF